MNTKKTARGQLEKRALSALLMNTFLEVGPEDIATTYTLTLDDRQYVVVDGHAERLAVYRVRAYDGVLRLLHRWPRGLPEFDPKNLQEPTRTTPEPPTTMTDPFANPS